MFDTAFLCATDDTTTDDDNHHHHHQHRRRRPTTDDDVQRCRSHGLREEPRSILEANVEERRLDVVVVEEKGFR
jgi:hypothetical protein